MQQQRFGDYILRSHLNTGGMGELYLADREGVAGFSKQVVVKCLRDELASDEEFVEMFLAEGRLAGLLNHPNIVQLYELGEVDGSLFMAMEYVPGPDLAELLERVGSPFSQALALCIMTGVCEGLIYAHDAIGPNGQPLHLVHRDINPQNILVSQSGAVKIADFGIAKIQRRSTTQTGVLKGKFRYLSPEQASGKPVDRRSDVFALGLLLFEVTLGCSAFPEGTDVQLLHAAALGLVRDPLDIDPAYPERLAAIFRRATALRKEDRYSSVARMLDDLLEYQRDQRILVSPVRLGELVRRYFADDLRSEWRRFHGDASYHDTRVASQPPVGKHLLRSKSTDDLEELVILADDDLPTDVDANQRIDSADILHRRLSHADTKLADDGEAVPLRFSPAVAEAARLAPPIKTVIEAAFRALDCLQESVMVIDCEYRVRYANRYACRTVGDDVAEKRPFCYAVKHGLSRPCYELGIACPVRNVLTTGRPSRVLHQHRHDGREHWEEAYAAPFWGAGEHALVLTEQRDASALLETRRVAAKLKSQLRVLSQLVTICTKCNRVMSDGDWLSLERLAQPDTTAKLCPDCRSAMQSALESVITATPAR
jgi:serine/threonine protein kinase